MLCPTFEVCTARRKSMMRMRETGAEPDAGAAAYALCVVAAASRNIPATMKVRVKRDFLVMDHNPVPALKWMNSVLSYQVLAIGTPRSICTGPNGDFHLTLIPAEARSARLSFTLG